MGRPYSRQAIELHTRTILHTHIEFYDCILSLPLLYVRQAQYGRTVYLLYSYTVVRRSIRCYARPNHWPM